MSTAVMFTALNIKYLINLWAGFMGLFQHIPTSKWFQRSLYHDKREDDIYMFTFTAYSSNNGDILFYTGPQLNMGMGYLPTRSYIPWKTWLSWSSFLTKLKQIFCLESIDKTVQDLYNAVKHQVHWSVECLGAYSTVAVTMALYTCGTKY